MTDALLLPAGTRLVHIGPHKTGSTALQNALHTARPELERQGVRYAGRRSHEVAGIGYAVGRLMPHHTAAQGRRRWEVVVDSLQVAPDRRAIVSSERLADAEPDAIRRIVDDLGGPRVHVVVTLRPLSRILPSQWQQYVQRGHRTPYEQWLAAILDSERAGSERTLNPTFWHRHQHAELIARWADAVGVDRVTVLVLDPADHGLLTRSFEGMLGLSPGTLTAVEGRQNRSLTWAEAETVRAFNAQFFALGYTRAFHTRLMRSGAGLYLKQRVPEPDEPAIGIPSWAAERAGRIGAQMAAAIAASGVRVVGDLGTLSDATAKERPVDTVAVAPELAARLAVGLARATHSMARSDLRTAARRDARRNPSVAAAPSSDLVSQLAVRARRRARHAARALRGTRRD